jgi:PAS domain-containing protein
MRISVSQFIEKSGPNSGSEAISTKGAVLDTVRCDFDSDLAAATTHASIGTMRRGFQAMEEADCFLMRNGWLLHLRPRLPERTVRPWRAARLQYSFFRFGPEIPDQRGRYMDMVRRDLGVVVSSATASKHDSCASGTAARKTSKAATTLAPGPFVERRRAARPKPAWHNTLKSLHECLADYEKMNRQFADAQESYRQFFDLAPIGFFRAGADGKVLDVNPAIWVLRDSESQLRKCR